MPVKADTPQNVTVTFLIDYGDGTYELSTVTIPDVSNDSENSPERVGEYASSYDALAAAASIRASSEGWGRFIWEINGVRMDELWWWSFWLYQPNGTWYFSNFGPSSVLAHDYSSIHCWRFTNGTMDAYLYPHDYPTTSITVSRSYASNSIELSGTLTGITQTFIASIGNWSSAGSIGLSGRVVTLYGAPVGSSSWVQIGQVSTGSDGSYAYTWTPDDSFADGSYQVEAVFDGDSQNLGSSAQTSVSVAGSLASATPAPTSTVAATPVSTVAPSQADTLTPSPTVPEFSAATMTLLVILVSSSVVAVFRVKKSKC
jgi:hypothetical protein